MDSKKKTSNEISKALEKMEQESAILKNAKQREIKRRKKHILPLVPEIDRQEVIKQLNNEDNKKLWNGIKYKSVLLILMVITTIFLTYSLSREERTTLIEQAVLLFLCGGMVLAASYKR